MTIQKSKIKFKTLFLITSYFFLFTCLSGCIRLTGTAGYWKKNADDEEVKSKSVTLDSDDLVYPNHSKGNITT